MRSGRERLNEIWRGLKKRCYNRNCPAYGRDGAVGITVCDEWLHDYGAFRAWAVANGYRDSLSIDRIKNHLGYSPDNCRWATDAQQLANRRYRNTHSQFRGVMKRKYGWTAQIGANHRVICLGTYGTEEQAARAYDEKARELYGEFASLNFPQGDEG